MDIQCQFTLVHQGGRRLAPDCQHMRCVTHLTVKTDKMLVHCILYNHVESIRLSIKYGRLMCVGGCSLAVWDYSAATRCVLQV